jgi:hypothetical protein
VRRKRSTTNVERRTEKSRELGAWGREQRSEVREQTPESPKTDCPGGYNETTGPLTTRPQSREKETLNTERRTSNAERRTEKVGSEAGDATGTLNLILYVTHV